jgi:hypothetical protein
MATRQVHTVLLASDSAAAVELFRAELPPSVTLMVLEVDRGAMSHSGLGHERGNRDNWVERRSEKDFDYGAEVMRSALEDIRLLAKGHLLIGAACSSFARLAHIAMVANNEGKAVPVISVDSCTARCSGGFIDGFLEDEGWPRPVERSPLL